MADAKIISYGKDIGAGTTVIPDNQVALDIESTDAKEYIQIDTSDSAPTIVLGKDGAVVGVNDSAPGAQLSVKSASTDTSSSGTIQVRSSDTNKGILFSTVNTNEGRVEMFKGGTSQTLIDARTGAVHNDQGIATYDFRVESDSQTHMLFVDGGANTVGIGGTATAGIDLHIQGTEPRLLLQNTTHENGGNSRESEIGFYGEKSDTTVHQLGGLRFSHDGTGDDTKGLCEVRLNTGSSVIGRLVMYSNGNAVTDGSLGIGVGSAGGPSHTFQNDNNTGMFGTGSDVIGFSTNGAEKMRLDANGNLGIAMTPGGSHKIDVTGTAGLSIGTAWTNTSDSRVKTNIVTIENALDKINQLRPVSFQYTDEYLSVHTEIDSSKTYNSFIAQEYEDVFPDAVTIQGDLKRKTTDAVPADPDNGTPAVPAQYETLLENVKQFTPHDLTMYLVRAVQEMSARIEELENGE